MMALWAKVKHVKIDIESVYTYHCSCCKSLTNKTDVNRSKKRFDEGKNDSSNILNPAAEISSTWDKKLIVNIPHTNKKRLCSSIP